MSFTVINCQQGTPEWFTARLGLLTGSCASAVLAKIKSGEAAERRNYRTQLACERITGQPPEDGFISEPMRRGTLLEPEARSAYEAATGQLVDTTGFLRHDTHTMGCSLDGHVGNFETIIEIKCPNLATHIGYKKAGTVPSAYLPQIRHSLYVTGAAACDFISYDPRWGDGLSLFITRVYAADLDLPGYEAEAIKFLAEVDAEVRAIQQLRKQVV